MTTYYSDLYGYPPNPESVSSAPIYKGPHGLMAKGQTHMVIGNLVIPAATFTAGDSARLCKISEGARLIRAAIVPSADLDGSNSFTFNLGNGATANLYASASTGLQGTAAFELKASDTVALANAAGPHGDELILARVAGALAAGTLRFVFEFAY